MPLKNVGIPGFEGGWKYSKVKGTRVIPLSNLLSLLPQFFVHDLFCNIVVMVPNCDPSENFM